MIRNPYLEHVEKNVPRAHPMANWGCLSYSSSNIFERTGQFRDYRRPLVCEYSWSIPTDEALKKIVGFSRLICEIGAGTGYWAYMLSQYGARIVAFDMKVPGRRKNDYGHERTWFDVRDGDALTITQFPKHTLMLCWPPYDDGMAELALSNYYGNKLIYIGEGYGGCTATDRFHDMLESNWHEQECVDIPQWEGIHDNVHLYTRK